MDHLMSFTYGQRPGDVLCFMVLGVLLWGYLSARFGKGRAWRPVNGLLFLVMVGAILHATLFWGREPGERLALLEPLQTLRLARLYPELYREMLMNVFLFLPLGLAACQLMPETWHPGARAAGALGLGLALSLCVETAQYLWGLGIAETDDVLCNTLGTALGTLSLGTGALFRKGKEDGEK